MSLFGTGDTTKFWSGASFITAMSQRPISWTHWINLPSPSSDWWAWSLTDESTTALGLASGYENSGQITWGDYLPDGTSAYYTGNITPGDTWLFIGCVADAEGGHDICYENGVNQYTVAVPNEAGVYSIFTLPGLQYGSTPAALDTSSLIADFAFWNGSLSATDMSNLYNGGPGGLGVNPTKLVSTSGATLQRYYLPVISTPLSNTFQDYSGNGGPTLAAQGGATPNWSTNDPPVNPLTNLPTSTTNNPLIIRFGF